MQMNNEKTDKKAIETVQRERGRRNEMIGRVVSDKMDKTITVEIDRQVRHRRLGKYIKRNTKFKAHDEKNVARVGDQVVIHASRPLSKTKYWILSKVLSSSSLVDQKNDHSKGEVSK